MRLDSVQTRLVREARRVPGLQYVVVDPQRVLLSWAGGSADLRTGVSMTTDTSMMAYSMTKTVTAVAVLQVVEAGLAALDDDLAAHLPALPWADRGVTVRRLLSHTAGIAAPIPLRWVHPAEEHADFHEADALAAVLRRHPRLTSEPGTRFRYSNLGYWLLGALVEARTGMAFEAYVRRRILDPLGVPRDALGFTIPPAVRRATGYLDRYSTMGVLAPLLLDRRYLDGRDGRWRRIRPHYLNGPAFGGLAGSAAGFAPFLQDQLRDRSILISPQSMALLREPQQTTDGRTVPMTAGWHVGRSGDVARLFKEGGGAGFHGEMRIYPDAGIGTAVLANSTTFNSTAFLNHVDARLLPEPH